MKPHYKLLVGLLVVLLGIVICAANGQTKIPNPTGHVNDLAGILSTNTRLDLERKLRQYEQQTSIEIAILTVKELEGTTIEEYATAVFNQWGIGKKGLDNGLLLVQSLSPRKFRSAVGYGLEAYLTDATMQGIQRNKVVPYLKAGKWDDAYNAAIDAVINELGTVSMDMRKQAVEEKKKQDAIASAKTADDLASLGLWVLYFAIFCGVAWGAYFAIRKINADANTRKLAAKEIKDKCATVKESLLRAKTIDINGVDDVISNVESLQVAALDSASKSKIKNLKYDQYLRQVDVIAQPILVQYSKYEMVRRFVQDSSKLKKCDNVLEKAKAAYTKLDAYTSGLDSLSARALKINKSDTSNLYLQFEDIKALYNKSSYSQAELACKSFDKTEEAFLSNCNEVILKLADMEKAKKNAVSQFKEVVNRYKNNADTIKSYGGDISKIRSEIDSMEKKIDSYAEFGNWLLILAMIAELDSLVSAPINKKFAEEAAVREAVRRKRQAEEEEENRRRRRREEEEESSRRSYSSSNKSSGGSDFGGGGYGGGGSTSDY